MANDYRLSHQAPGPEEDGTTISLDQVGGRDDEVFPADVLKNPQNYGLKHPATATALEESRGNPEEEIRIWRAVPQGTTTINPGDWIALSKEYAVAEAQLEGAQVITATAQAKELWTEGLLEEWGYQGTVPLSGAMEYANRRKTLESFPTSVLGKIQDEAKRVNPCTVARQIDKPQVKEVGY